MWRSAALPLLALFFLSLSSCGAIKKATANFFPTRNAVAEVGRDVTANVRADLDAKIKALTADVDTRISAASGSTVNQIWPWILLQAVAVVAIGAIVIVYIVVTHRTSKRCEHKLDRMNGGH